MTSLPRGSTGRILGRCVLERAVEPVDIRPGMGAEGPVPSESVRTGAELGLAGCVVSLASVAAGKDWPERLRGTDRSATLGIEPGRFEPRVQWTRSFTQLVLESRIGMELAVHGFHGSSRTDTAFNLSVAPGARHLDSADLWLDRPGILFVTDDFRGGFQAYVHVSAHPYVDVTGAETVAGRQDGSYALEDVPPGAYELVCWHEGLAPIVEGDARRPSYRPGPEVRLTRSVRVVAGETTVVDFTIPAPPR